MFLFILRQFKNTSKPSLHLWNFVIVYIFLLALPAFAQIDLEKRLELEKQLQQLEVEAREIDQKLQKTQSESTGLSGEVKTLDIEIKRRELEIKKYTLAIKKTELEIKNKNTNIVVLTQKIDKSKKALAASIFLLNLYDQDSILTILLKNRNLSDFFGLVHNVNLAQSSIQETMAEFKTDREELKEEKAELEGFQEEQEELKALQEVERRFLAQKKKEKDELLRLTKGKEALFQQLLKLKKKDITTLKTELFYLEKTGVTAEDAVKFADLAAKRVGIRTSFLLALLEVETGKQFEDGVITVGSHLGSGNWERDLYNCYLRLGKRGTAEAEKKAFFKITGALNLNPNQMPVSRKPNYGCGGAMGPAQFLPTTWLRFADKVSNLTGHNFPNPWNIEDAFTAAALFLAEAGASSQTQAGEMKAAKTYLSGNPTCSRYICKAYANRILSLAKDIDKIL